MTGYIYTLSYESPSNIFYVGSTYEPDVRLKHHRTTKGYLTSLDIIEIIEVDKKHELQKIEEYWINQFKAWGFELKNKDCFRSYLGAPKEISDYIVDVFDNENPYSEITMKDFKETLWKIIKQHKELAEKKKVA